MFYFLLLLALTLRAPRSAAALILAPLEPAASPPPDGSRRRTRVAGATLFGALAVHGIAAEAATQVIRVGPHRPISTIAAAAAQASDGATVEVDAGEYRRDVASWDQNRLTLRAVGGRVRLVADGAAAERKGIWVIRGQDVRVEGFDFVGAHVPDRNGAGIRLETGSLHVVDCSFSDNEMGILTNNDPDTVLEVEDSEFAHNYRPDGHNHNLYAGAIRQLSVSGSYFHDAVHGHLLKSRAALNRIAYNRLADGPDGHASYELEFPNGGVAYVIGNIIEQGVHTENAQMVSYGAEGYRWPANALYLVHNTLIDPLPAGGVFLRVWAGPADVHAIDNVTVGHGRWYAGPTADLRGNQVAVAADFDPAAPGEYRLRRGALRRGVACSPWPTCTAYASRLRASSSHRTAAWRSTGRRASRARLSGPRHPNLRTEDSNRHPCHRIRKNS
jgi:hypothetical protein